MPSYTIHLNFGGGGFVAVPNGVADDRRLTGDALAALVYLARLAGGRDGCIVRVAAVRARFGWGRDRWQSVARSLRAVGALSDYIGRTPDGRGIARALAVGWPQPVADGPQSCEPGNPAHTCEPGNPSHRQPGSGGPGNPAQVGRATRLFKKEKKRQGALACADGLASPRVAARPPAPGGASAPAGARASSSRGACTAVRAAAPAAAPGAVGGPSAERGARASAFAPRAAAEASGSAGGPLAAQWAEAVARLSRFERSQVRTGRDVLLQGVGLVRANSQAGDALRRALAQVERGA
jgi:hypothetical protein